jgi:hypothetical protein
LRYQDRDALPAFSSLRRPAMIIPLDIALALTGGAVFFAFLVAVVAD